MATSSAGLTLLPTPAARDYRSGMSNIMDRNSRPLNEVVMNLLPTPTVNGNYNRKGLSPASGDGLHTAILNLPSSRGLVQDWVEYEPAIRRWETIIGYEAPLPTAPNPRAKLGRSLSPAFPEWMMGIPGRVSSVPGLSRNDLLKLIGNGVVPQQGERAIRGLWALLAGDLGRAA